MALELGLSDAGLIVPRTADYLSEIREQFAAETGLDVDWDNDLILGVLSAIMAQLLDQQAEGLQAIYDAFNEGSATGVQLSNIARLTGTTRKAAIAAQATVTLGGDPGTEVLEGKLVEGGGSDGRARWALTESVVIGAGGTVDVVVAAVVPGYTVATPGEIDAIVTPVPGWDSVTNAEGASPGADAESDTQLRIRRRQSLQSTASLGIAAIRGKVLALSYVEAAAVIDNPDSEPNIVEGISMPASSYLLILTPDTLTTSQKEEILRLLYDNTPVGIASAGSDEVGTVTGEDGFSKPVGFDYAVDLVANIAITLDMAPGYSVADAGPALRALVEAHIAKLTIGDALRRLQIFALAATIPGVLAVDSLLINGVAEDLDATAVQRVVAGTWSAVAA